MGRVTKITLLVIGDLLLLYLGLWLVLFFRYPEEITTKFYRHVLPFSVAFASWLIWFSVFGLYELRLVKNDRSFYYRMTQAAATNLIFAIILFYLIPQFGIEPRTNLLLIVLITTVLIATWRYVFNAFIISRAPERVIFFGISRETLLLVDYLLKNPQLGHKPVAFISHGEPLPETPLPLPNFSFKEGTLDHVIRDNATDIIVISPVMKENKLLVSALFKSLSLGITVIEFPSFHEMLTGKIPLSLIGEVWFLENLIGQRKARYDFFKRIFDIIIAALAGIITLIVLPFIALGIVVSNPHDLLSYKKKRARPGDGLIFFRQPRVGQGGVIFDFVKFRSQVLGAEKMSKVMSEVKETKRDPRQYAFGKFLRRAYIDELGQIWNVLRGEMSFIGPRPERPEYVEELKKIVPFYEMRLIVKPGITGWAQVNMENDAAVEDAPEKMQYDLYYIKNRSILLDLSIALRTFFTMISRTGR